MFYLYLFIYWLVYGSSCTPDPTCVTLSACTVQSFKCVHVVLLVYSFILLSYHYEIMWNANLMQQGNFIDIFLARQVSGT